MGVFTIYLCLGGTWVPVVTEKGLLGLAKIATSCFEIFVLYLCLNGKFGYLFLLKINWRMVFFDKFCWFGDLQLGLII